MSNVSPPPPPPQAPPPPGSNPDLQEVLDLVRHRVQRLRHAQHAGNSAASPLVPTQSRDSITVNALPLFAIPAIDIALSQSTLVLPLCALCGAQTVCSYLSNFYFTPRRGSLGSSPSTVALMPRDLCEECMMKVYHGVVRPALAQDDLSIRMGIDISNLAQLSAASDADAAAALKRLVPMALGSRWTCPRCTYAGNINGDPVDNGLCAACGGPSPHLTSCVHCGVMLTPAHLGKPCVASLAAGVVVPNAGRTPVATTTLRRHVPWECASCTFINTVDTEDCHACQQSRMWECPRCGVRNSSRRGVMGERDCFCCGHQTIDLAASTATRMGLDPEAVLKSKQQDEADRAAIRRLDDRLGQAALTRRSQLGDGNCQFRSLAQQIFRNPELHMFVRFIVTEHMKRNYQRDYAMLFDGVAAFQDYIAAMRQPKAWGDEMTLRAAADEFKCSILVVTSDVQRWLLRFDPSPTPSTAAGETTTSAAAVTHTPTVVLAYQYPVHYDDVAVDPARVPDTRRLVLPRSADIAELIAATLHSLEVDESQWDDAADDFNRRDEWLDVRSSSSQAPPLPPPPSGDTAPPHSHHNTTTTPSGTPRLRVVLRGA